MFNLLCNKNSFIIEVVLDNSPASRQLAADACFATCNICGTCIRRALMKTVSSLLSPENPVLFFPEFQFFCFNYLERLHISSWFHEDIHEHYAVRIWATASHLKKKSLSEPSRLCILGCVKTLRWPLRHACMVWEVNTSVCKVKHRWPWRW